MKANTVFVHRHLPQAVLQGEAAAYFRIATGRRGDLGLADEVTGDLLASHAKWCFNVTRATLIRVRVLSRHRSLGAALLAAMDGLAQES